MRRLKELEDELSFGEFLRKCVRKNHAFFFLETAYFCVYRKTAVVFFRNCIFLCVVYVLAYIQTYTSTYCLHELASVGHTSYIHTYWVTHDKCIHTYIYTYICTQCLRKEHLWDPARLFSHVHTYTYIYTYIYTQTVPAQRVSMGPRTAILARTYIHMQYTSIHIPHVHTYIHIHTNSACAKSIYGTPHGDPRTKGRRIGGPQI
jgi:hypothetical protein